MDNEYDELGQLKTNKRNGQANLQTGYTYNIRSAVKTITNSLFRQTLYYNDQRKEGSRTIIPRYNGNISGMDWSVAHENKERGYDFTYDHLSRLTKADYLESKARNNKFNTAYTYDKQGNVLTLTRRGNMGTSTYETIDNLTLSYQGNQLVKVEDAAANPTLSMSMDFKDGAHQNIEYAYDENGNQVKDLNKGISKIEYNLLNLPSELVISNSKGAATNTYLYGADGSKLKVTMKWGASSAKSTDYVGNMIYENGTLKRILVVGGYIEGGTYHYYLQDHLGNNRVVAKADGTVVQTNHYYPFGMAFAEGMQNSNQPYRYNGKELDTERGLNLYDYSARQMEAIFGRFITVDPLAEKYYSWSPYVYCGNNPIKYVDLRGDSLSLGNIQKLDESLGTNYTQQITRDLQSQTGLTITNSNGIMSYAKDSNGNPIIAMSIDSNGNSVQSGSVTARDFLIKAINHRDMVTVVNAANSGVPPNTNELRLSIRQIEGFIKGTVGMDNRTLGWGMTSMHELHHTQVGGGLRDTPGNPGPVVTQMNIIRSELNAKGGNYGQRLDYPATLIRGSRILPFDSSAKGQILLGLPPLPINRHIKY